MCDETGRHLAVLIGAHQAIDDLRRVLVAHDRLQAGVGNHLRGLRSLLMDARFDFATLFITLDAATMNRFGVRLVSLVRDQRLFDVSVRSVGLLIEPAHLVRFASLGCDCYVHDEVQAVEVMMELEQMVDICICPQQETLNAAIAALQRPDRTTAVRTTVNRLFNDRPDRERKAM